MRVLSHLHSYLHRHHVGLLALVLAVGMSGTAYAAGRLAKNSVASPQVRNNSLTSGDIRNQTLRSNDVRNESLTGADVRNGTLTGVEVRDGTLTDADLAPAVGDSRLIFRRVPEGTTSTLFADPTLGSLSFTCNPALGMAATASTDGPAGAAEGPVSVYASGVDLVDTDPVGQAALLAPQGAGNASVGVGGSGWQIARLEMVLADESQVVHAELQPQAGSPCTLRAVVTRDANDDGTIAAPVPPRGQRGGATATCEQEVGAGYCVVD